MELSDLVNKFKKVIANAILTPVMIAVGSYSLTTIDDFVSNAYAQDLKDTKIAFT